MYCAIDSLNTKSKGFDPQFKKKSFSDSDLCPALTCILLTKSRVGTAKLKNVGASDPNTKDNRNDNMRHMPLRKDSMGI